MFKSENELQKIVDENPHVTIDALMEISPTLNGTSVSQLFSLGRDEHPRGPSLWIQPKG